MSLIDSLLQDLLEIDQSIIKSVTEVTVNDPLEYRGCNLALELEIEITGIPAKIVAGIPELFPNTIPKFFDKCDQFGFIPHKEPDGFICFTRNESLVIDERYPGSIILNCLEKVIKVIEDGIQGENKEDYIREFEVYWARHDKSEDIYAHIDTSNFNVRLLNLWQFQTGEAFLFIAGEKNSELELPVRQLFQVDIKKGISHRCIFIPLKQGTFIKPPDYNQGWDFNILKSYIFSNLSSENMDRVKQLIKKSSNTSNHIEAIILGIPFQKNENMALCGYLMTFSPPQKKKNRKRMDKPHLHIHPFIQKPFDLKMIPAMIQRWHPNHLLKRTGGNSSLTDKHVVVVGAGSIGSEIAVRLAKAGVKQLTLIDYDMMTTDNIHRHALGSDNVYFHFKSGMANIPKVYGLKIEINRKYPFTNVEIFNKRFSQVIQNNDIQWKDVDLVYVAIGSPNQEMLVNRHMYSLPTLVPAIYTWVEPLGIGGHVLVTRNQRTEGCYQCLFQPIEEEPLHNLAAFAEPFQEFSKTITGCGSVFTPYSFLDSERTAILAVDIGIKVMMGIEYDNPLLSWKGEGQVFFDQGFHSTPRYSLTTEALHESRLLYKNPNCPICKPKEETE
jgi:molybdopterin-synthase adenylyltransferase